MQNCVCHRGVMWDPALLTGQGHCPQYFVEQNDNDFLDAQERQAAYDEMWG